jgi:hypothetical protein
VSGSNINAFQSTNTPAILSIDLSFFHRRALDTTMAIVTIAMMAMMTMEMMATITTTTVTARAKAREV